MAGARLRREGTGGHPITKAPTAARELWAHTALTPDAPWQRLEEHTQLVAALAERFALPFQGGPFARLAGQLHDLGKADPKWQAYLSEAHRRRMAGASRPRAPVDHRLPGAYLAAAAGVDPLALIILGHHGGLREPDLRDPTIQRLRRLNSTSPEIRDVLEDWPAPLIPDRKDILPAFLWEGNDPTARRRSLELFIRFAFSALVDADHLDTARHFDGLAAPREGSPLDPEGLLHSLEKYRSTLTQGAEVVRMARQAVYAACLDAAALPPGVFQLEAPTGSGKTLAALAFALRHAQVHGHRRVVVALPYLTILEQTVEAYRRALGLQEGSDLLLEHHSALDPPDGSDERETDPATLAAENWDSPIVVTTTIQLFESIFSNRTRRCRKLHNLAGSVVILDEAQALPAGMMEPILDVIAELSRRYGVTFLITTATQPSLEWGTASVPSSQTRKVLPDAVRHFQALKRVDYEVAEGLWNWETVANLLREEEQAMVVVNTRRQAVTLLDALDGLEAFHLSTYLYGAHRSRVLSDVRNALARGAPCRLVATQVVEAGVDLDFPVVLRALGPLERIAQAAGRCNREGKQDRPGRVIIFEPQDGEMPRGAYRTATDHARLVLRQGADLHDPDTFSSYFQALRTSVSGDGKKIQAHREALDFPAVAEASRFIDDTLPVVVLREPQAQALMSEAVRRITMAKARRSLQRYTVNLRPHEVQTLSERGLIRDEGGGLRSWVGLYEEDAGIGRLASDPVAMVIG